MNEAEARETFAKARVARLATLTPDGAPHIVPICFAVDGDVIYSAIDHKPKRTTHPQRLRNINCDARVAVLADHYDDHWENLWWVRADGRGRVVAAGEQAVALLARRYEQYRERPPRGEMIVIEVARWSGWGNPAGTHWAPSVSHVDLVVSSLERSLEFYSGLLAPIGWRRQAEIAGERGERVVYLGITGRRAGSIGLRQRQSRGTHDRYRVGVHHVCFEVVSREEVDERYGWLLSIGAQIENEPREYDYTPGYYATFFYDPDGIKLEVLHRPGL